MPQLGKAYIEVYSDVSKLPADLKAKLKKAFAEGVAGVDFDALGDRAAKAGEEAAHRAGKSFEKTAKTDMKRAAERAGEDVGRGLFGSIRAIFSRGDGRSGLLASVKGLFGDIKDTVGQGVQSIQSGVGQIGGALGGIASGGGDIVSLIKVTAIIALIPAVFALAGALVHLSGALLALPAAAAVAGAGIGTLVVAFQGFGEAVSAGLSGDTEKFNQALKGLAEPAQKVAREIVGLKSIFKSIKNDVQTAFFAPMIGIFKLLGKTLLPQVRAGMTDVADALGNLFAKILKLGTENDIFKDVLKIFVSAGKIIRDLSDPITELFAVMFGVIKHALPFVERFFHFIGQGLTKFTDFLSGSLQSGSFEKFLQNAADIGKELIGILGEAGHLIKALFGGQDVKEGSQGFLRDIKLTIKALADFFETAEGKKVIEGLLTTVKGLGIALIGLAIFTGKAAYWVTEFANGVAGAVLWVLKFLQAIGGGFVSALKAVGGFFEDMGSAIADFFTEKIPHAFDVTVGFLQSLPDRIRSAIVSLFEGIISYIAEAIGRMIGFILALPYLIETLPARIGAVFDTIVGFFQGLGERALSSLASFGASVLDFFVGLGDNIRAFAQSGVDAVVNFFSSLPGRVAAFGPALLNAARGLGHKIGDGLSEIGNFASDIGKKIVSAIKSGINFVIDGINRGISDIDDKIPISLPRLPHFERGGVIDSPTVALLGEKNKREVVLPLTDPGRAQQLAEQSGLTKILSRGAAAPTVNLTAHLDGFGVIRVVKMVVNDELDRQGDELAFGART